MPKYTVTLARLTRFTGRPVRERLEPCASKAGAISLARYAVRDPLVLAAVIRRGRVGVATIRPNPQP